MRSLVVVLLLAVAFVSAEHQHSNNVATLTSRLTKVKEAKAESLAQMKDPKKKHQPPRQPLSSPAPTWFPPPKFHGYITMAQWVCDSLLCPNWELKVSRLATECYTIFCSNEEFQESTLVPSSPRADMDFPVFTAYDEATRMMYISGQYNPQLPRAYLWTVYVNGTMNSTTLIGRTEYLFPQAASILASFEADPVTHMPLAIFQDGTIQRINPKMGNTTTIATVLPSMAMTVLSQVTAVNNADKLLYLNYNDGFGGGLGFFTLDLKTLKIVANVTLGPLPYNNGMIPQLFNMLWIPDVSSLILLGTGNWDQLIWVNPTNGNTSYALFEIDEDLTNLEFCGNVGEHLSDTWKNAAYDPINKQLYFQATVGSDCTTGDTSLIVTSPFAMAGGAPGPVEWLNAALSPIDFGYTGMHYTLCVGTCPT